MKKYENANPIAVLPINSFGGLVILDIEYGIEDYAIAAFEFDGKRSNIRRHKIHVAPSGENYIRKNGVNYSFSDMIALN